MRTEAVPARARPRRGAGWRKALAGSRGQSLAELAILLPVWLLLVIGMMDLGRAFHAYISIQNAAREGARYGALFPGDTNGILQHARREVLPSGINLAGVEVNCPNGECTPGNPISVTVRLNFQLITAYIAAIRPLPLQATAQFVVM